MIKREYFEEYAALKIQEKEIAEKIDTAKENIMAQMMTVDEDNIVLKEVGTFIKVRRKNWKYTEGVDKLALQLKETKAEEEAKGIATFKEVISFMFRANQS